MTALTVSPAYLGGGATPFTVACRRPRRHDHHRPAPLRAPRLPITSASAPSIPLGRVDPARQTTIGRTTLRLTRRGRLTVTVLVTVAVTVAVLTALAAVGGSTFAAGTTVQASEPASEVVVLPGETLWSIAGRVDPEADRRDVILQIRQLNDLETSMVLAGQTLLLPTG